MGALAKLLCMAAMIVSGIFLTITDKGAVLHPLGAFLLYIVLGVNVFEALRTTALVLDKYDETWLQDKQGKVGFLLLPKAILLPIVVSGSCGSCNEQEEHHAKQTSPFATTFLLPRRGCWGRCACGDLVLCRGTLWQRSATCGTGCVFV